MEQRVTVEPSGKLLRMILSELSMQFVPLAVGDSIPVHTSSLPALVENVQFFMSMTGRTMSPLVQVYNRENETYNFSKRNVQFSHFFAPCFTIV